MGLSSVQAGVVIASCAGAVIFGIMVVICVHPGLNRLASSMGRPWCLPARDQDIELQPLPQAVSHSRTPSVDVVIEQYGELWIASNGSPLNAGLDIITRVFFVTGLPAHTIRQDVISAMEQGRAPRVSLHLPRPTSMTPSEQVGHAFTVSQATALNHSTSVPQNSFTTPPMSPVPEQPDVFVIGDGDDNEDDVDALTPPAAPSFGTGKGMAQLYLQSDTNHG